MVVLLGVAVFLWVGSPGERSRRSVMGELEIGDDSSAVIAGLGAPPARCAGARLQHLAPAFPPGWPQPSVDAALQRLGSDTRERWVYPIRRRAPGCAPGNDLTEIGVGRDGKVLWFVTVTGKTPLQLPEGIDPADPGALVSP